MRIALIEIEGTTHTTTYDLDNLQTEDVLNGPYLFKAFEVPNMGSFGMHEKEFGFIVEHPISGVIAKERVRVANHVQSITVKMDPLKGQASNVTFDNGGFQSQDPSIGMIREINQRMYFHEELMDLFVMNHISKEEYFKIRKLFRSSNEEDRNLAKTLVEKQHEKYIQI